MIPLHSSWLCGGMIKALQNFIARGPLGGLKPRFLDDGDDFIDSGLVHEPCRRVDVFLKKGPAKIIRAEMERDLAGFLPL